MPEIHPTALIDDAAELAEDVVVEAFAVVGANVRLGPGCRIGHHATVEGPTELGEGNLLHPYAYVGAKSQDLKYDGEPTHLVVGARNTFREFCTIHRATSAGDATRIGDDNLFLAYCHVAHDCMVGNHVIMSNNGTLAGHVEVQDHAIIGGLAGVHQFCRIGAHAMVGGCCKIVQDVAPFLIADGNPAEIRGFNKTGLERRGFAEEDITAVRDIFKVLYREKLNRSQAADKLRGLEGPGQAMRDQVLAFLDASQRGLV